MKKKILGVLFLFLALTFIYVGTYAYYMRVVNGTISANTGGWMTKLGYDSNNPLIWLPIEVDTTNTDPSNPTGIKDVYFSTLGNKIVAVGGAFDGPSGMSNMFGLWLFDTTSNSTNIFSNACSRLIRHQTSTGRNFGVPQGEDWTYTN